MSGAFVELQRAYAAHRVATYPLTEGKTPAITSPQRVGLRGSGQLAMKFPDAAAIGFNAGARNRLTIVDIDDHDDRLVDEIQRRYGATPLQVVTPSGGRHLYFRHGGEARRIRPDGGMPVDILGGGNVVAAGSIVPKGRYQIERGTLDDLARLPRMRHEPGQRNSAGIPAERIAKGRRNAELFEFCKATVARCDSLDDLVDAARTWADDRLADPLQPAEIVKTCNSVWTYRGGRRKIMTSIVEGEQFKALIADPFAIALYVYLDSTHDADSEFWIADGLAELLGWPRRALPAARRALLGMGLIECVRRPAKGVPARYRWASRP